MKLKLTGRLLSSVGVIAATTIGLVGSSVAPASATVTGPLEKGYGAFTAVTVGTFAPTPFFVGGSDNPCSIYTGYHATLGFDFHHQSDGLPDGATPSVVADIRSGLKSDGTPGTWAESPYGTYQQGVNVATDHTFGPQCDAGGAGVGPVSNAGFTATLTSVDGLNSVCQLSGGSYQRGNLSAGAFATSPAELNVEFVFTTAASSCVTVPFTIRATIPSADHGTVVNGVLDIPNFFPPYAMAARPIIGSSESVCAGHLFPPGCALAPAGAAPSSRLP